MIDQADQETFDRLRLEMRRGVIVLAVLAQLQREHYGYSLRKALGKQGVKINEGTLYPLVRRLEQQGLLESEWRKEDKRKKRFYSMTTSGREVYDRLCEEWRQLNSGIHALLDGGKR